MVDTGLLEAECATAAVVQCGTDDPVMPHTDEDFVRMLYQQYRPLLHGYTVRLTRDVQWAEDIVQAALVRAWRARDQLTRGEGATRQWLFTTAYRIFIDEYRSRTVRPVALTGEDIAGPNMGPDEVERLTWSVTLASALSELPAVQRQAIVHVYYLSRTIDETASVLGISAGTIKSRLYYGLRALRHQLTPRPQAC
jgi:RNA polymerase sigma-70 factor (ECF subfamily)